MSEQENIEQILREQCGEIDIKKQVDQLREQEYYKKAEGIVNELLDMMEEQKRKYDTDYREEYDGDVGNIQQ